MHAPFNIRQVTLHETDALFKLENECFSNAWTKEQLHLALQSPHILILGIFSENILAAYVTVQCIPSYLQAKDAEAEILNIATDANYRRQGLAEALLRFLLDFGYSNGMCSLLLDVRQSNVAAKNLYDKLGFKVIAVRKKYYPILNNSNGVMSSDSYENGYIMQFLFEQSRSDI